jgi:competence protein ComEC
MPRAQPPRVLVALLATSALLLPQGSSAEPATTESTTAKVVFVDVGQGDGVIVKVGSRIIVSDAGLPGAAGAMDAVLEDLGAEHHIYRAILSHAHADHIGGFIDLIEKYGYTVERAVYAPHQHYSATKTNKEVIAAFEDHGVPLDPVHKGHTFRWGGASWRILNPPEGAFAAKGGEANASVAFRLRMLGSDLLFTGDMEQDALAGLVSSWTFGSVEVLLVTHHGSNHASAEDFLAAIDPAFAVLSNGTNSHGHPGLQAIRRLEDAGATIFCTDWNGTLTVTLASGGKLDWRASEHEKPWWTPTDGQTGTCVDR